MDAITELIALIEKFRTSVLRFPALAGIAVTAAVFALEIKWSRAHAPGGRRVTVSPGAAPHSTALLGLSGLNVCPAGRMKTMM